MNLERGDKMALYKASLFFNYYVAVGLSSGLGMPILKFTRHYKSILTTSALTSLVHFSLTILMIPAVIVMFNTVNGNGVDPSVYIIRTVVFCIMILRFISLIAEMLAMCVQASYIPKSDVLASMLQNALLLMWAIFMASRTFLPLDNLARDSEAMFYGLNIVPLFVIGLIPRSTVVIPDLPAMRGIV
ncbi:hypothetical protein GGF42_000408 [Coemansia sp. RSA 2424]|nr:hypothetical protein GGF42_000408 [Coemansia sp. RSA 2424]